MYGDLKDFVSDLADNIAVLVDRIGHLIHTMEKYYTRIDENQTKAYIYIQPDREVAFEAWLAGEDINIGHQGLAPLEAANGVIEYHVDLTPDEYSVLDYKMTVELGYPWLSRERTPVKSVY